jgi:hypothetical protein
MVRKRRFGLAASVAVQRDRDLTPPGDGRVAEAAVVGRRRCFAEGRLWDRQGRAWHRVAEWLEPSEARALVSAGAPWLVEWCGGRMEWSDELADGALVGTVLPAMVPRAKADRLARRRAVATVIVAERWRDEADADLVLFYESAPRPRATIWFA